MDLKAIRERVEKASAGEWESDEEYIVAEVPWGRPGGEVIGQMHPTVQGPRPEYSKAERIANADFSANAKQDVPNLLDALEKAIGFGGHTADCAIETFSAMASAFLPGKPECTCGWQAFLTTHGASDE